VSVEESPLHELAGDLRSRVLAAVRAEPAPTRRAAQRRNVLLLTAGAAVALTTFLALGGFRAGDRPTRLVAVTCVGWIAAAAVALQIAFARGRSMVGRHPARRVALLVGAPFLLFAWKVTVTACFGVEFMATSTDHAGYRCLGMSLGMGLALLVVFAAARRRTDPVRPGVTGAALGMAAAIAAGSLVDAWCPYAGVTHLLLGHILPLVALAALGALVGRRFLRV